MNIGIYISPAHCVPPNEKNILAPWELVKELTNGLVLHGHQVHLFCAEGSKTNGIQHSFGIHPTVRVKHTMPFDRYRAFVRKQEHALFGYVIKSAQKGDIDLIHIHQRLEFIMNDLVALGTSTPCITTFHEPITKDRWSALQEIQKKTRNAYVSISNAQRLDAPLQFIATVYHGISLSLYVYRETAEPVSQFLIVGRVVPDKGFKDAIEAVQKTNDTLMILGQVYPEQPFSFDYYKTYIQPFVNGTSIYMRGIIARRLVIEYYQKARALLFPIHWEEPFGLVMIEAMACGTPVVAYARGSVPEVLVDGVTGFIINETDENKRGEWIIKKTGVEGLVEAMNRLKSMSQRDYTAMRRACRRHVEDHFSVTQMVTGYERVYNTVIQTSRHGRSI